MRKPKSEARQRTDQIKVRVTPAEKASIDANADGHSITTPEFLRRLGCNVVPTSTLDHQVVRDLAHVAGDLGRLGGLLKLWLADQSRGIKAPVDIEAASIHLLWSDLQTTYELLKTKVKALR